MSEHRTFSLGDGLQLGLIAEPSGQVSFQVHDGVQEVLLNLTPAQVRQVGRWMLQQTD